MRYCTRIPLRFHWIGCSNLLTWGSGYATDRRVKRLALPMDLVLGDVFNTEKIEVIVRFVRSEFWWSAHSHSRSPCLGSIIQLLSS
jgi:hypothetical protein